MNNASAERGAQTELTAQLGFLEWLKSTAVVIGLSTLPVIELKGAIPAGLLAGLPLWSTFLAALLGSSLPVLPVIIYVQRIFLFMRRFRLFARFADYLERRARRRGTAVAASRYAYLALFVFVAIPLPMTGVWTGSIIAALFNMRVRYALPAILLGNVVAGFAVLSLSYGLFG